MSKDVVIQRVPKEITVRNLPKHFNMKDRLFILKLMQENYKQGFLNGLKFLFIIILFCSIGCSRKVALNKSTEKAEIEIAKTIDLNVKKTESIQIDDKTKTVVKTIIEEPIDPTRPAYTTDKDGNKTELNNSKKTTTDTTTFNDIKTDKKTDSIVSKKINKTAKSELKKDVNDKQTEKTDYTFLIIGLVALFLLALKFKLLSFGNN